MHFTFLSTVTLAASVVTYFTPVVRGQQQSSPQSALILTEPLRATLYPEVFCVGCVIPEWDGHNLLHKEILSPVVTMYDENGKKVLIASISRPDFVTVFANAIAATHSGGILAGAAGDQLDGTRHSFLARTDSTGRTTQSVLTPNFGHLQVCEAPDGSMWTLGLGGGDPPDAKHILRHYSFDKGLLGSFISIDSIARSNDVPEVLIPRNSYLHCGNERVAVYLALSGQYIEVNTATGQMSRWKVDMSSAVGEKPEGFAVTENQNIFVAFANSGGQKRVHGLYALSAVPGNPIATLTPVEYSANARGAANSDLPEGAVYRLWGADGNSLVVSTERDGWGVSWVKVISSHIAPD